MIRDRHGKPFTGTAGELHRHNEKLRKRDERAAKKLKGEQEIKLPLPAGTAAALADVMQRAGFDDPRDFIAFQIHRLASLDGPEFEAQAKRTVRVTGLGKYLEQIAGYVPPECDE